MGKDKRTGAQKRKWRAERDAAGDDDNDNDGGEDSGISGSSASSSESSASSISFKPGGTPSDMRRKLKRVAKQ